MLSTPCQHAARNVVAVASMIIAAAMIHGFSAAPLMMPMPAPHYAAADVVAASFRHYADAYATLPLPPLMLRALRYAEMLPCHY